MSANQHLATDYENLPRFFPNPPLLTSFQAGWSSIQLAHYCQPSIDIPEVSNPQHSIAISLGHQHQGCDLEFVSEGRLQTISYHEKDFARGFIEIVPANSPCGIRSISTTQSIEWINCYLEPTFLAQIAYESVNPDRVELLLTRKKGDALIHQIGLALRASLETVGVGSRLYADSMATAMAAHLIHYYSTRKHFFRKHEDGLSKQKLRQAIEYIQAHLGEDISLIDIATELGMSQYYLCHLFKRSTGISPHQFLIHQRVERARLLLKQPERTVLSVALECGFANQSHFARCFRQCTGVNPNQFRKL
ncbi:putative transcriptional regulator [Leptolyngbya boryana NIES-2135]|jgi:AraC family transcriptional regulator|uniref:Putative transcriptional regulator n=1 Tax=Leptolyngbya boryana NIES-2135 TaxID=1973484 RepID=A0A1Z4JN32_LEPBY|nr:MULTISPECIES: AraC family transcriptional regulator [Leptolyngbya]BAY58152.1 putative transcriptional regulator [Leptolyngbya boryana NIES-2135]MBD2369136.1 helix-turn-helix transcriptional regulator [Leptolyngbya sp. FACHB-161]MBD2375517.1 helix-turn-helix transcriptional regulator [Leptolyngbya sp. FACHB-238]MBD2400091.1 helix-turn-helix transcriptional regulator [Leptolyngbya sp. FACHB-239]MBD2406451.1 helix-turn-helix transcriptional regulator [Leptolyngbya sp. FACHB-402]